MKHADIPPTAVLTTRTHPGNGLRLLRILGEWSDSGFAAPWQILTLKTLTREVGSMWFLAANYKWLTSDLRSLKVETSSVKSKGQAQPARRPVLEGLRGMGSVRQDHSLADLSGWRSRLVLCLRQRCPVPARGGAGGR